MTAKAFVAIGFFIVAWKFAPTGPGADWRAWLMCGFCALAAFQGFVSVLRESPGYPASFLARGPGRLLIAGSMWIGIAITTSVTGLPALSWWQLYDESGNRYCSYVGWNGFVTDVEPNRSCPLWRVE